MLYVAQASSLCLRREGADLLICHDLLRIEYGCLFRHCEERSDDAISCFDPLAETPRTPEQVAFAKPQKSQAKAEKDNNLLCPRFLKSAWDVFPAATDAHGSNADAVAQASSLLYNPYPRPSVSSVFVFSSRRGAENSLPTATFLRSAYINNVPLQLRQCSFNRFILSLGKDAEWRFLGGPRHDIKPSGLCYEPKTKYQSGVRGGLGKIFGG